MDRYRCIFAYDISSPKNMRKLYKLLDKQNSIRIQKSVIEILFYNKPESRRFFESAKQIADSDSDRLVLIHICDKDSRKTDMYGKIAIVERVMKDVEIL